MQARNVGSGARSAKLFLADASNSFSIPESAERQRIGDKIKAAFVFARARHKTLALFAKERADGKDN